MHGLKTNVAKGFALMTDEDRSFLGLDREYDVYLVSRSGGEMTRCYSRHDLRAGARMYFGRVEGRLTCKELIA